MAVRVKKTMGHTIPMATCVKCNNKKKRKKR